MPLSRGCARASSIPNVEFRRQRAFSVTKQMTKPLNIEKLTLPVSAIHAMAADQRSALLLLGLFLNEVNWLRKLLARAVSATPDEPEGQANFALTVLLATTLVGKVHEGWDRITEGTLCNTLDKLIAAPIVVLLWAFGLLVVYGVVVIIFRYAFGVELWNPFH
jgi:hypothetical protein